jgi:hypothetical protein
MYGDHFTNNCGIGGFRQDKHNTIVRIINDMLQYCGYLTTVEPKNAFAKSHPSCHMRPDIIIHNTPYKNVAKLAVDVTIVNTLSGGGSKSAVSDKQGKYTELCKQNNMDFLALAFESSGKMHEDVIDFVKAFVKPDAENRGFDPDRSTKFWISQISMAIQRLSSQMIITRSCQINGRFQNPAVSKEISAALENFDVVDGRACRNHSNFFFFFFVVDLLQKIKTIIIFYIIT